MKKPSISIMNGSKKIALILLLLFAMQNLFPIINASALDEPLNTSTATTTENISNQNESPGSNTATSSETSIQNPETSVISSSTPNQNSDSNSTSTESVPTISDKTGGKTVIGNENQTGINNNLDTDAASGSNDLQNTATTSASTDGVSGTSTGSTIKTGGVDIANAVVNLVNNNVIGNGVQFLVNVFKKLVQNVDLSGYSADNTVGSDVPELSKIENNSTSTIDNKLVIKADTGNNIIASSTGPNIIETGDISIANDVINMANLNIVGKGWFFAVVNIFGEMDGDIILPAITDGDSSSTDESATSTDVKHPRHPRKNSSSELLITNTNYNDLENNIKIDANSGNNIISSSTYDNIIKTGSVNSKSNVFNLVNYNVYSNSWKFYRINIYGDWDGEVHGLPEGYDYFEDENGITIYKKLSNEEMNRLYTKILKNNNTASTTNNLQINANTGNNSILHSDSGSIKTGNIDISNNILNFINSNFMGDNWQFSLINVFGSWKGNLAFGKPDLWITQSNKETASLKKGESKTYTILYGNKGDSTATNAKLKIGLNGNLAFTGKQEEKSIELPLGSIPPNTQGSVSYAIRGGDNLPIGSSEGSSDLNIDGEDGDRNYSDNTLNNKIFLDGGVPTSGGGGGGGGIITGNYSPGIIAPAALANLSVVKTNDAKDTLRPGETVNFTIKITNTGNAKLERVAVADAITNISSGEELGKNFWDLGIIDAGEEINLNYALEIKTSIKTGTYLNQVTVEGFDNNRNKYISALASSKIRVENPVQNNNKLSLISLAKISKKTSAKPNEELEQEIIIANNGSRKIEKISISEKLPADLTYQDKTNSKTWIIDSLTPGQIKNIKYKIKTNSKAKPKTHQITTSAKASGYEIPINLISKLTVQETKILETKTKKVLQKPVVKPKAKITLKNTIKKIATKVKAAATVKKLKIINPIEVLKLKNPVKKITPKVKTATAQKTSNKPVENIKLNNIINGVKKITYKLAEMTIKFF